MLSRKQTNFIYKRLSTFNSLFFKSKYHTQKLQKPQNFIVYCNTQITKHGREGNLQLSESIFTRMPRKTPVSYTAMLTAYAQNGHIHKARQVFDEMPERTTASYNAMITAYINNCKVSDAFGLFSRMEKRNAVSYAAMITGFVRAGMVDKAEELYMEVPTKWRDPVCSNVMINAFLKAGKLDEAVRVFGRMAERDVVSWSSMVDGYCKTGRIDEARELFDSMPEKNVVTWSAMIDGYMNAENFEEGFDLFVRMRRDGLVTVNSTMLSIIFEACMGFDRYREGLQMHGLVLHMGFEFDVFLGNSIINMYSNFSCIYEAERMFRMLRTKDVITYNLLISGYLHCDRVEEASQVFEMMPQKDVVSWTTMIAGFCGNGNIEKSIELFRQMPEKDDVAWTALISGLVNNEEYEQAFCWFIEMLREAVKPNELTFSSMLSVSGGLATLDQGSQVHAHVVKMKMECDLSIQNSLVSMYSKCGNIDASYRVFNNIENPNVVSFNSMIYGFAQNGLGAEALNLFREMQNGTFEINDVTFLGIISACAHSGLVEEGRQCFELMKFVYDIEPGPDHYACMVDLLGRAGLLDEAVDLIRSMPFEPNSGVWGALIGVCRTYVDLDLAKLAAQQLIKLEPDSATPYVILSELYNVVGETRDSNRLRNMKKSKGLKKTPGCSWITLKDKLHLFLSGDKGHLDLGQIKLTLQAIAKEMRGLHYP